MEVKPTDLSKIFGKRRSSNQFGPGVSGAPPSNLPRPHKEDCNRGCVSGQSNRSGEQPAPMNPFDMTESERQERGCFLARNA